MSKATKSTALATGHGRDLKLMTCSWNVGNAEANPHQLKHLFPHHGEGFDIIVIGLQESTYKIGGGFEDDEGPASPSSPAPEPASEAHKASGLDNLLQPCYAHLSDMLTQHAGPNFYLAALNKRVQMQL